MTSINLQGMKTCDSKNSWHFAFYSLHLAKHARCFCDPPMHWQRAVHKIGTQVENSPLLKNSSCCSIKRSRYAPVGHVPSWWPAGHTHWLLHSHIYHRNRNPANKSTYFHDIQTQPLSHKSQMHYQQKCSSESQWLCHQSQMTHMDNC